jgi:nicotinate phosphoribosyltransferase
VIRIGSFKVILKTDLYQVAMLAAHYKNGSGNKIITCEAFARKMSDARNFLVMAGTSNIKNFLENMKFSCDDISYLKTVSSLAPIFNTSNFETYLEDFKFTGDMWAMVEGEVVFPEEPLVRITAPISQAHMVETYILSVLNYEMKIASKAARIVLAARGKQVVDFSTRRNHHEAAIDTAKAAYLAGFSATSNVKAGQTYGIPIIGTMSHMWVMAHNSEEEAYQKYKEAFNQPSILVDTHEPINGTELAVKLSALESVRLDSGDLANLSKTIRSILDNNCRESAKIIVSGDLNEYKIEKLFKSPIDTFAVGTELVVNSDNTSLGIVYKAVYNDDNGKSLVKLCIGKESLPGKKQVFLDTRKDKWTHLIAVEGEVRQSNMLTPLLDCYIKNGVANYGLVGLEVARRYCNGCLANLHKDLASLNPSSGNYVIPHISLINLFKGAKD